MLVLLLCCSNDTSGAATRWAAGAPAAGRSEAPVVSSEGVRCNVGDCPSDGERWNAGGGAPGVVMPCTCWRVAAGPTTLAELGMCKAPLPCGTQEDGGNTGDLGELRPSHAAVACPPACADSGVIPTSCPRGDGTSTPLLGEPAGTTLGDDTSMPRGDLQTCEVPGGAGGPMDAAPPPPAG